MKRVGTVGDNCVDVYEREGMSFPGGNPVNVAVYLRRMGVECSYTGTVGTDEHGRRLIGALAERGIGVSHVREVDGPTAVTMVEMADGNRVFGDYFEGVMENFSLAPDDIGFLCSHDIVVSGIWGHTEPYLKEIHESGTTVVFDSSDQPKDPMVDRTLPFVDYAFFGLESEDTPELRDFLREKRERGPRCVIATLGDRGSVAFDGKEYVRHDIVPCPVVDTMGAGDSFIAGFIKGLLEDLPIYDCMEQGAQQSAATIGYSGAW